MSFYSLTSYSQLRVNQGALDGGGTPSFSNLNSFEFDGIDEHFLGTSTYSEIDGLNNFAFSFWIKPTTLSGYKQILTIGTNSADYRNQQIQILIDNGKILVYVSSTSYYWRSTTSLTQDVWQHILVTRDSSRPINQKGKVFINGIDVSSADNTRYWTNNATSNSGLMIGRHNNGWASLFGGKIDEVAVYTQDMAPYISEIYGGGEGVDLNNLATAPQPTTWQRMGDNATWNGATWTMTDVNGGYTNRSINMVEANRTTDVPTIPFSTKSIALDGVDDYVDIADNSNLSFGNGVTDSPFSISTWVKMDDATKFRALGKYGASNVEYLLATGGDDKIVFYLYQNSTAARIGRKYDTALTSFEGQWIHLAITYNGNSSTSGLKIYLNGTRVDDTNITSGTYVAMENTTQPLYIGKLTTTYANGNVDETAIFNSELSQSDVNSIYGGGSPSSLLSYSSLVSWWRCGDGDTAPTLTDNGSGGNNGTMTNFTTFSTDVPT